MPMSGGIRFVILILKDKAWQAYGAASGRASVLALKQVPKQALKAAQKEEQPLNQAVARS